MLKKSLIAVLLVNLGLNSYITPEVKAETSTLNQVIVEKNYSELRKKLEDFIYNNTDLKKAFIGVKIKDLNNNQEIYSLNSDKLFVPASNMKVFTTLLSLEKLGKDYRFSTKVTTDGFIEDNFLNGNLYFNFVGDPTFKSENLKKMLIELKNLGINKINGKVFITRSAFDNVYYGPGWMWDDMDSCDSSPIDAIYMDDNCLKVNVISNKDKIYSYSTNSIIIDTSEVKIAKDKTIEANIANFQDNKLKITGAIGSNKTQELEQTIFKPDLYVINFMAPLLKSYFSYQLPVNLDNDQRNNLKVLTENISPPVSEILKRFDKESHNLTGELLIKTIALNDNKTQGSTKKGVEIMKDYLEKKFLYTDFNIVDGSGLSRYNLVSPNLMMDTLDYIYRDNTFKNIVFESFPIGNKDGTLKNRLKNIKNFTVIAKSGSMTGVNCLSGYLKGDDGHDFSFSIMINNANLSGKILRDFQDNIIRIVTDYNS